ncbi:MAG: salicylyl-CoA 5-hydroxylase [Deltaproteobacteria bacterium]|nr:salicylyl-CoA 5-hydroxylase [Deltaproteobacteria bacterium]
MPKPLRIACIGGGPAGLYLGILVKRVAPEHDVVIYERNRPAETFGFGVVFSDATLGHLAAADPETHRQITDRFARWDDIEIHVGGEVLRSTGHGFCGIERKALLEILQTRARELGVRVEYEHEIKSLSEVQGDVIVACDGVASWVRDALASELSPDVDVRPNKFVWLGCTVPFQAFTFLIKPTPHGLFRVHAYRYNAQSSTFIVECREETWRSAGLDTADEDRTVAILADIFAAELGGYQLVKNRSIWRNFPTVRCGKWHTGNVVLVGDAAHTAHFSIGSGTKLAMEDVIVLRDELLARPTDIPAALASYETRRRPEVEALQAAAQASLEWFEGTERYMAMAPVQLTYSLMTRSLRVSHASVAKRDPHLARGVEHLLAASVGITGDHPPPPTDLPFRIGDRRAASRIVVAPTLATSPDDDQLVALGGAVAQGASVVVTAPLLSTALDTDDAAVAWGKIVDYVHGKGALIAARIVLPTDATLERTAFAGFDLLVLDPGSEPEGVERLAAALAAARAGAAPRWRRSGWLGAVVHDRPLARAAVVGHAAQLVRAGANLLWIISTGDGNARLAAAPLADRLRNELRVATCIDAGRGTLLPDLEAAIAAGRADLVAVEGMPSGARRA